jgi:hypothetical protein
MKKFKKIKPEQAEKHRRDGKTVHEEKHHVFSESGEITDTEWLAIEVDDDGDYEIAEALPVDYSTAESWWLQQPVGAKVNLLLVLEGYTAADSVKAKADAKATMDNFFAADPVMLACRNAFNVKVGYPKSPQAGCRHPKTAADCFTANPVVPIANPTTIFNATFDYGGTHRLLYCTDTAGISAFASTIYPGYHKALVLVNTPYYGGSGGTFPTASAHATAAKIMAHEFGHGFAGLGDEYGGGQCSGQEKPNCTKILAPLKWQALVTPGVPIPTPNGTNVGSVGAYLGANYCTSNGWYRPSYECLMRTLDKPFCKVCADVFKKKLASYGWTTEPPVVVPPVDPCKPALSATWLMTSCTVKIQTNKTLSQVQIGRRLFNPTTNVWGSTAWSTSYPQYFLEVNDGNPNVLTVTLPN